VRKRSRGFGRLARGDVGGFQNFGDFRIFVDEAEQMFQYSP
jgi:hypothetical protein